MSRKTLLVVFILFVILIALLSWITHYLATPAPLTMKPSSMKLISPAFADNQMIPTLYACNGSNISPPLTISGVPAGTVSLALIVDDPDAPRGTWDHWVVFNIDKDTREIPEGTEPHGTPGVGSNGKTGYAGPCPPSGTHRYIFTLYALDTMLSNPSGSNKADVIKAMNGHILAQALLIGKYGVSQ